MSLVIVCGVLVVVLIALLVYNNVVAPRQVTKPINLNDVGDITIKALEMHNGYDPYRQILVSIKGAIYDVTPARDLYAPGKELHMYAGQEISRALAKDSTDEADCNDKLEDLTAEQLERLEVRIAEYATKYEAVGKLVPLQVLTLEELKGYDGTDPGKAMYLSIKGLVYDISKGKAWYGPDGVYPFAGKEVARAFALNSVNLEDCTDKLDDLQKSDLQNLREWEGKFNYKYPIVGVIKQPTASE